MKSLRRIRIVLVLLPLLIIAGFVNARGQETADVVVLQTWGHSNVKFRTAETFVRLVKGARVGVGDTIETGDKAKIELKLPDESKIVIGSKSRVVIKELNMVEVTRVSTSTFELLQGKIRALVVPFAGRDSQFNIETDNATIGVRGTDFGVIRDPNAGTTHLLAVEGTVQLNLTHFPDLSGISVIGGEEITVSGDKRPPGPSKAPGETVYQFLQEMMVFPSERGVNHGGGGGGMQRGSPRGGPKY